MKDLNIVVEKVEHTFCKRCRKDKTWINRHGIPQWRHAENGGFYCHSCYDIIKGYAKKRWAKRNTIKNPLRVAFLGKRVVLTFQLRKHVCKRCGKQGYTHIHHLKYVPCMPWACTEELCPRCHGDDSYDAGQIKVGKYSISFFESGEKNPRWRGGVGQRNQSWRKIAVYDRWRDKVLERDQYKCQECGCSDVEFLEAHHIKKADQYPELRYDLGNGITCCRSCHNEKRMKVAL